MSNARIAGKIDSVGEFAQRVAELTTGERSLFRGQNTDLPLKPKIARHTSLDANSLLAVEQQMLDRFKKESLPRLRGIHPTTDWDWLSVAQHHGMSTRLLDWSANALAALWFAVSVDPPAGEDKGVVWTLCIGPQDLASPSADESIWDLNRTYVFQPLHMDQRISAQSAWFSAHRYSEESGTFIALDSNRAFEKKLNKLFIPRTAFVSMREDLRKMGVTKATLFPDLSGLAADIDEEYLREPRNPRDI